MTNPATASALLQMAVPQENLLDTIHRTGHFKHLLAFIRAAGLVDTFNGAGPYTWFAPNDHAFGKLPDNMLTELLKPEGKARLAAILKLHVVAGHINTASYGAEPVTHRSLQGDDLAVDTAQGLRVNKVRVVERDMEATNGVVHVLDTVLMPAGS